MPVSELDLDRYVTVAPEATVAETVQAMRSERQACACVVADQALTGVFTQRDVLWRVLGRPTIWDRPIAEEMTRSVKTIGPDRHVADGLAIMIDWWVRNVPVVEDGHELVGNLSFQSIMRLVGRLLRSSIDDESSTQLGLSFVDFTGLNISAPVSVAPSDSAEVAAHHMKARGIGSVLVTDARGRLVGVLTEFDLLMKIGCDQPDVSQVLAEEVMTHDPVALPARASIADAIDRVVEHEFSHVPLMGESNRPVGVASLRDIAGYIETSLVALG